MFLGKFPTAVHLIINRIPIDHFPTEKRDIEKVSALKSRLTSPSGYDNRLREKNHCFLVIMRLLLLFQQLYHMISPFISIHCVVIISFHLPLLRFH